MIFENIKTIPTSDELLDKAFKRSIRTFSGKRTNIAHSVNDSYESMILTASNILSDNLKNIIIMFPNLNLIDPFYKELSNLLVNLDRLKQSLSNIHWASKKIHEISREYIPKIRKSKSPRIIQKQIFGRLSSIIYSINSDLIYLNESRNILKKLPDINSNINTIIIAGYPNVGKSSFVSIITNSNTKIDSYPFTTKNIEIGHFNQNDILFQVVDTPGLLDRKMNDRNKVELQSIIALKFLKAIIIILVDFSENCGYSIYDQINLVNDIKKYFSTSIILVVANKQDLYNYIPNNYLNIIDSCISTTSNYGISDLLSKIYNLFIN